MAEFVGKVTEKLFGEGSKSEHDAIFLETKQGQYVLRRQNANPFYDPELHALVGKTIHCDGIVDDYVLTITDFGEEESN